MLSSVFLSATNHLLSQSGWARARLQAHAGRTARLAVSPVVDIDFSVAAEFADALGFVFRHLRWDAEEDLARIFGDMLAHRVVEGGRQALDEGRRTLERAGGNLAEYLTEEAPVLVPRTALPEFFHEIVELRDALGRLEKRVGRIENKHILGKQLKKGA